MFSCFPTSTNTSQDKVLIRSKTPLLNASNLLGAMANASTSLGRSKQGCSNWLHTHLARTGKTHGCNLFLFWQNESETFWDYTGNYKMPGAWVNNLGTYVQLLLSLVWQPDLLQAGLSRGLTARPFLYCLRDMAICSVEPEIVEQFNHPEHHRHRARLWCLSLQQVTSDKCHQWHHEPASSHVTLQLTASEGKYPPLAPQMLSGAFPFAVRGTLKTWKHDARVL